MEKQSFNPLISLAGKAVGFAATKVVPKVLGAGWSAGAKPLGRFIVKHPGMALTGAFIPSSMSGYMTGASGKTLSSLPRKLPSYGAKFASERGDDMLGNKKYPAVFYGLDGFNKMAAEAETAQRLVKKAFFGVGKLLGSSTTTEIKKDILKKVIDLVGQGGKSVDEAVMLGNQMAEAAKKLKPAKSFLQESAQWYRELPTTAKIAIPGIPIAVYAEKTLRKAMENHKMNESYKNMLRVHPDLQKENPRSTRQYFDYIKTYSPTIAKNPHASGALVKRFVHSGGMLMDNSIIENLLKIEKTKSDVSKGRGVLSTVGEML